MLDKELITYARENVYPFHMPGHKRRMKEEADAYSIDITEIDGFDNLHEAEGILKEAMERAARLYGAAQSFYLVNGSTCGILAAVSAATRRGGRILVARNCHKAVYHAMYLQGLTPEYVYPKCTEHGIAGAISPEAIRQTLERTQAHKDSKVDAVLITSPTYDGIVSDISRIAEIVHSYRIPLIVDEAHGAHFGFSPYFPASAVSCGADLVIQSLHKTLPSFTQTALLHVCSNRVSAKRVQSFLDIYETSSPSYLLMAGMERCIRMLTNESRSLFAEYEKKLQAFIKEAGKLKHIRLLQKEALREEEAFAFDRSKLLFFTAQSSISGKKLYDMLLHQYGLQMEMVSANYVLAMTSIMDTQEGFTRLLMALQEIDAGLSEANEERLLLSEEMNRIYEPQEMVSNITDAVEAVHKLLPFENAQGKIAAGYLYLYPPGIPLLVPGERITAKLQADVEKCQRMGLKVCGLSEENRIEVVSFDKLYYT